MKISSLFWRGLMLVVGMLVAWNVADAADAPVHVVMFAASKEYQAAEMLPKLKAALDATGAARSDIFVGTDKGSDLTGFDKLNEADVAVIFTRRVKLDATSLDRLKAFCKAGKGIVGIRTASHAFDGWPTFDREVLGGDYHDHRETRPAMLIPLRQHFILKGFTPFPTTGKLYKNPHPATDIVPLIQANTDEAEELVAWARELGPQRTFYTSLGVPEDFEQPAFIQLLARAVFWTAHREPALAP